MQALYRNKQTGEFREVEQDSPEMFGLQTEVGPDGNSKWEQTSIAHADAVKERASEGALRHEDLGTDHQADAVASVAQLEADAGPEDNPHLELTPGEIEAGLTPGQKNEELKSMFQSGRDEVRTGVLEEAADLISDGNRTDPPAKQQARGLRARAGGSDDREGAPKVKAKDEEAPSKAKAKTPDSPADSGS